MRILPEQLEKLKGFCQAHQEIAALYLFGSTARGTSHRTSDVDIAIMTVEDLTAYQRIDLETLLSNMLGRDVDLTVFAHASPLLQHQVLKYGLPVYERDPLTRVRQEVRSRTEYLDSQYLYRELR